MKAATFIYYGETEENNRTVRFCKRDGSYVCEVEGMPALMISHPSFERVRAAFNGWYQLAQKDFGASDIDWGDMTSAEKGV